MHSEKYVSWRQTCSDVLTIRCKECDWFFASLDELESHLRSIHPIKGLLAVQKRANLEDRPILVADLHMTSPTTLTCRANDNNEKSIKCKTRESLLRLCKEIKKSSPDTNRSSISSSSSTSSITSPPLSPESEPKLTPIRQQVAPQTPGSSKYVLSPTPAGSDEIFDSPPLNKMEAYFAGNITTCPYLTGTWFYRYTILIHPHEYPPLRI